MDRCSLIISRSVNPNPMTLTTHVHGASGPFRGVLGLEVGTTTGIEERYVHGKRMIRKRRRRRRRRKMGKEEKNGKGG